MKKPSTKDFIAGLMIGIIIGAGSMLLWLIIMRIWINQQ